MHRRLIQPLASLALTALVAGSAHATILVTMGDNNSATAANWTLSNGVPAPSTNDYAGVNSGHGATVSLVTGALDSPYNTPSSLLNDQVPTAFDQAGQVVALFNAGDRLLVDLQSAIYVQEVRSYTMHNFASNQKFVLWGAASTLDPTAANLAGAGWTQIAAVVAEPSQDGDYRRHVGTRITDTTGSLGFYRYLLWQGDNAFSPNIGNYGMLPVEFDVFQLPEPSICLFGAIGGLLLWRRGRK